jgi:hypothetical protein
MSNDRSITKYGGGLAIFGLIVLLIGFGMPATTTFTSETCVDDPTGVGQDCFGGSVTSPNPMRGPVLGVGFLALIGGVAIYSLGGMGTDTVVNDKINRTSEHKRSDSTKNTSHLKDSFADQLRERQQENNEQN